MRKAELAVDKKQDDLARAALERHQSYTEMAVSFNEQLSNQRVEVENLKSALAKLEQKLSEAKSRIDLLIAQHRRSRAVTRASDAQLAAGERSTLAAFDRMKQKVLRGEAVSQAKSEMVKDDLDGRLAKLEREDRIEQMLAELKARRGASA